MQAELLQQIIKHLALQRHPATDIDQLALTPYPCGSYGDQLYPGKALQLLQQQRTGQYPGIHPDNTILTILKRWLVERVEDPGQYLTGLDRALREQNCLGALGARLGLLLWPVPQNRIQIISRVGAFRLPESPEPVAVIPVQQLPQLRAMIGKLSGVIPRDRGHGVLLAEQANRGLGLEQELLVRISCVIIATALSRPGVQLDWGQLHQLPGPEQAGKHTSL